MCLRTEMELVRRQSNLNRLGASPLIHHMQTSFWDDPDPSWFRIVNHDQDGKSQTTDTAYLNQAYIDKFFKGLTLTSALKHVEQYWPKNDFDAMDAMVLKTGLPQVGYETGLTYQSDVRIGGISRKWPIRDYEGDLIAIGGRAVESTWKTHTPEHQAKCLRRLSDDYGL